MADNSIDLVVSKQAFDQLERLLAQIKSADAAITALNTNAGRNAATPSGAENNSAENAKLISQMKELTAEIARQAAQIKKLEEAKKSYSRAVTQESVDTTIRNQKARESFKETSKEIDAYQKLDAEYKKAVKSAQALGAQYGANSKQFLTAANAAKELDTKLKAIDSNVGKYGRNVGNYASGWNGLANSVNQLTREAPAFANSLNTGFMALSNNIPILYDEIDNLRKKNEELAASGKPTESVFKTVAGAFFSWQTALSVGVTLLTLYGGKLIDFITGADRAKKVLEAEKKALDDKNKALEESRTILANYQSEEISRSKILFETAKNLNLTYKEREEAVNQLQQRYPDYLGELSKEKILAGDTAEAEELLNTALVKRGVALAAQQEIQKIISDNLKNEKKLSDELLNIENKRREINEKLGSGDVFAKEGSASKKMADERNLQLGRLYYLEETVNEQYKTRKATIQDTLKFYLEQYNQNSKFLDVVKETNSVSKKTKEEEKEYQRGTEKWFEQQIARLKEIQSTTADTTEEYKSFIKQIEALEKALELLRTGGRFPKPDLGDTSDEVIPSITIIDKNAEDPNAWMKQYAEDIKKAAEEAEKLKRITDNFIGSFTSEFLQNSGLSSFETFFDGTFDKLLEGADKTEEKFAVTFNAIAESAQEAFNFISNASQQNFDAEYARLEAQKDIALQFAGESESARAKVEEDAEKRRKEIAAREFKAKKTQSMVNIVIDTAQAVVSAIAKSPLTFGLPWSAVIAGLGAAQLAVVASQKVPQYFDGTDNHPGGLALINDGKGSNYKETVVTPDGKVRQYSGRDVLIDAPAGTQVFTHDQWNNELNTMIREKGISMSNSFQSKSGLSYQEMDSIIAKHFSKITTQSTVIDRNGFNTFVSNGSSKTIRNQSRYSGTGFAV
jgi:DNA repair exonuclease SbcCD ATPase subunit